MNPKNPSDKNPTPEEERQNAQISMEARMVAVLLGECSDFERAELEQTIEADPELKSRFRELAETHRQVSETLNPDVLAKRTAPQEGEWRLATERRTALMQKLGIPENRPGRPSSAKRSTNPEAEHRAKIIRTVWRAGMAIAALIILTLLVLPAVHFMGERALLRSSGVSDPRAGDFYRGSETSGFFSQPEAHPSFEVQLGETTTMSMGVTEPPPIRSESVPAQTSAVAPELSQSTSQVRVVTTVPDQPLTFETPSMIAPSPATAGLGVTAAPAQTSTAPARSAASADPLPDGRIDYGAPIQTLQPADEITPEVAAGIAGFSGSWQRGRGAGAGAGVGIKAAESRRERVRRSDEDQALARSIVAAPAEPELPMLGGAGDTPMLEGLFKESAPERSQIAAPSVFQNRTQEQSVSTFSLHVGDVSFRNAEQALLTRNALPSSAELRTEEFTAAFDYGDPAPAANEPVSLAQEQSRHPVLPETNLLRLSFRTATEGREQNQPLHLVVLLDTSGSMERPDRSEATLRAIEALEQKISEEDRITVVSFDRATQLVEDRVPGPQGVRALRALHQTTGESGTNLEDGLKTVRDISMQRQIPGASNRVLLITDGIANLGATVPESLGQVVADLRQNGVSTDIVLAGVPDGGDAVLRTLARKGDGRYFSIEGGGADVGEFARQLAGAFRPAARNVKLQVRFNPDRVEAWSLLGFEDHLLAEEDFRDDSVLAADLAAAEQATALYQVRIAPEGTGELGMVSVRFEETATGEIVERRWVIPYDAGVPPLDRAAPSMQLAAAATLFGEFLRGTPEGQLIPVEELEEISRELQNQLPATPRVETLHQMIQQTQQLKSP